MTMQRFDQSPFTVLEAKPRVSGSRVGGIVAMRSGPIVDYAGNPLGPQRARVVSSLQVRDVIAAYEANLPVLIVFEHDDPGRPIVVDIVIDQPVTSLPDVDSPHEARELENPRAVLSARGDLPARDPAWIGRIVALDANEAIVQGLEEPGHPVRAAVATVLRNLKEPVVVLTTADGPVVVAQIYSEVAVETPGEGADVVLRGSRVTIEADVQLVLKAGTCVVQLDARGKTTTTADQIVSRARGANKVQGGSVQLN